jgi:ankyrin repeat protein
MSSQILFFATSGIDVNAHNHQGLTPLCIAAGKGNTQVLKVLVDAGADINKPSLTGFAPLSWAVMAKQKRAVDVLRKAGG